MPNLLNYKSYCEDLPEITSIKAFNRKKFHPEGLFSEQKFGPLKNYTCQCGIYHGPSKDGSTCDVCKVLITNNNVRRTTFAKIVLPIKIVNPIMYDLFVMLGNKHIKKMLDDLMNNESSILYEYEGELQVTLTQEQIPRGAQTWEKSEATRVLVESIAETLVAYNENWQIIIDNIDNFLINEVIVLPPELRPVAEKAQGSRHLVDPINLMYKFILQKKLSIEETILDVTRNKTLYYDYFKQIQYKVKELYNDLLTKLSKKEGIIRGNILGKRIDFSGRAVIAPDPKLNLDECRLPYIVILELFKLPIAKKLIHIGRFKILNKAIEFVDECIDKRSYQLLEICKEVTEGEYCILNRQPTLHRLGMLAFKIKVTKQYVIKIHPLVCPPYNADFDGDQMAVYIPVTDEARKEIVEKMLVSQHLNSPANESLTTTPSQDIILGIYFLTSEDYSTEKIEYKNKMMLEGRVEFNKLLPEDYPIIDKTIAKKELINILNDIKENHTISETIEVLDKIKEAGFKYATQFGCTLSLKNFPVDGIEEIQKEIFENKSPREQLAAFSSSKILDIFKDKFKYAYMIDSGARGSWDQVKQLILARGFVSNFDGEILPEPIKHSTLQGLTQREFFRSTYGCRKGLLDIALNTGTSGYLARKLIFTCVNMQLDENTDDCGTTDYLKVGVHDELKASMLVHRWCLNEKTKQLYLITKENYKDIIGKTILIRSPIMCKNPMICKKCYGESYKRLNSRFVGIIAAQTLGERSTQLVLRVFHTSGSAIIKGEQSEDMKQKDIIGDLSSISNMLHNFDEKSYIEIVDELFAAYNNSIYHVHYECIVAQLMWHKTKKWRLLSNRNECNPEYLSILAVPNHESWILAMAFSNPKKAILNGIIDEGRYEGALDKILKGQMIE